MSIISNTYNFSKNLTLSLITHVGYTIMKVVIVACFLALTMTKITFVDICTVNLHFNTFYDILLCMG